MLSNQVDYLVTKLGLKPHPEGGISVNFIALRNL